MSDAFDETGWKEACGSISLWLHFLDLMKLALVIYPDGLWL
jgi:hypothetical protein